ncbi:indolepyruvate ferredoxin oxidoreductase subunit alpha [Calorimonas adulescens]|uniref:Indolepyruvate oxidoreductase subunit IorA n=1 Tax=Calorimonas adulescens TaxID=2606906 RepID=A0A5D8Q9Z4_9THEO|nr:indolepyruvate ferredoxin oxidoreductase subunit alpha [Calorimonas adulescens]TZE81331.1 indolepyruvate ferredoxin oxidoreductase subunit alpha [Calorimonas adulescens]
MRELLTGNEAVARGAYEYGITVAAAYPGTPSTEILENIAPYDEIYAEWSPNEKVALEVALGAAFAGARSLAAMKHVGLNVAADPMFTSAYTGVNGAFIIVTADDPGMHSSQDEQDNRYYAKFAKIPMLEPSDSQECKEFVGEAVSISEEFDTPVILRLTTRISHSKSLVELGTRENVSMRPYRRNAHKYVTTPGNARVLRVRLEERLKKLKEYSEKSPLNHIEWGDKMIGIITSGIAYQYAREVMGDSASYLKLGMTYPLPDELIKEFASQVEEVYVVEELEPYLEEHLKALGIKCHGKDLIPIVGELNPEIVARGFLGKEPETIKVSIKPAARPPLMCPGCPHRGVFFALSGKDAVITGDIGCYTLGSQEPLSAMDTTICMGASVSNGHGFQKAFEKNGINKKVFSVIGDSTFFHSGMTGLLDIAYNKGNSTLIILDNRITAMTGQQENPGTGYTLKGEPTFQADLAKICNAMGIERVREVNSLDLEQVEAAIDEAMNTTDPMVIIAKAPCALLKREKQPEGKSRIDVDICQQCGLCLQLGCPAIYRDENDNIIIDEYQCNGCTLCQQVCEFDAIETTM